MQEYRNHIYPVVLEGQDPPQPSQAYVDLHSKNGKCDGMQTVSRYFLCIGAGLTYSNASCFKYFASTSGFSSLGHESWNNHPKEVGYDICPSTDAEWDSVEIHGISVDGNITQDSFYSPNPTMNPSDISHVKPFVRIQSPNQDVSKEKVPDFNFPYDIDATGTMGSVSTTTILYYFKLRGTDPQFLAVATFSS